MRAKDYEQSSFGSQKEQWIEKKQESVAGKIPGTMDLRRAFFLHRRAFFLSFSCVPFTEKTRKNRIGQNRI